MKIRVFIADDHAVIRDGLRALLEPYFDVVGSAANGREAVRLISECSPAVAILDIAMPELNGIEATRLLRQKQSGVRVVILSMHCSSEHVFRAFEAGADGYLLKESASDEIVAAVRTTYAGRRYLCREIEALALSLGDKAQGTSPLASLSAREREVLQLVVEGRSSAEIGHLIYLSPKTVETYRSRLMKKLGIADLPALVRFAIEHGLTPPA
ncbi:response regulator transcription factor [Aromatoleum toluclasticum]|uniref:response regulator n=1 Tax=Aromatoleum toluclasticum TaxID=92003 RepID=UPI00037073B9|nr:response regulator transcription factor [Aromatoleum toluclasticum]MCC4118234.1 response regulator transcription factor [Aromatoleum toluclasticum]